MSVVLLSLLLTALTVVVHSLGTHVSVTCHARLRERYASRRWLQTTLLMTQLVGLLLITHLVEVGLWAIVYCRMRMLPDFATAAYYSLTSYSTVGYGDVVLPVSSRLLGPIESLVGVLMLGWSTAIIVTAVQQAQRATETAE